MKAYHTTKLESFEKIKQQGGIQPSGRERKANGGMHYLDVHAKDRFVFLSSPYFVKRDGIIEKTYGFVYNAEDLILEYNALVGPDLLPEYIKLMHKCAKSFAKDPCEDDKIGLVAYMENNGITEIPPELFEYADENASYYDIWFGIRESDTNIPAVCDTIDLYENKVLSLQKEKRCPGAKALELLKQDPPSCSLPWEILVEDSLPLKLAIGEIEKGEEVLYM